MNAFTSGLHTAGEGIGKGIGGITSGIGKGVEGVGNTLNQGTKGSKSDGGDNSSQDKARDSRPSTHSNRAKGHSTHEDASGPASGTAPLPASTNQDGGRSEGLFNSITSSVTSGASFVLAPTADAVKSGATLARDATTEGFSIGQKIAKSGLNVGSNVVTGTASLAGTALGGVVTAAAETSGAVFEPVCSGLKAIEGLDKLGQGVGAINGLAIGAVSQVSQLTTKALNMSGMTPTFFDPDADGIVSVPDTVRGLVLLGLDEKNATYAAYALHAVFSYPTSENWLPEFSTSLPIHVAHMGRTRWGKNWGSFERIDWVDDVEIDKFFVDDKEEKQWSDYWKQGRQGFGILLLLFEWGTTWPFYIPPVPVQEIPFSNEIGMVVRKAILPTILLNFKKVREANTDKSKHPSKMPSPNVPTDPKDA